MFNMCWKYVFGMILFRVCIVYGEYECHTLGNNVSCTALEEDNLYENLTVVLTQEENNEIQELQIINSSIYGVKRNMFVNFQNIQILRLENTSTRVINDGAFENLFNLKKIFLTNNYLEEINSNTFISNNSIHTLDVSHNLLNNLDNFDVWTFPALTIMNISHNRLEYLPENMLDKLSETNKFYLIVDNNPWNCLHPKWSLLLTDILIQAFCTNKTYDSTEIEEKEALLEHLESSNGSMTEDEANTFVCLKYSLTGCLFWAFGAVWVGIIIGNVCKLKRMLFTSPKRYEDKNIQCEYCWKEPYLREEYVKVDNLNKPSKQITPKAT